ncbi:unnamed protein product [Protopolystoma xenopodis]|uniref:Uncharacterized protein n=1 Tax=Protopolystoma xenopodis TaxID=117903 RepID=A0A3S5FG45_9PLAT|nr:unnamed protein product [Protopolystoma xenopodis]
MNSRGAVPGPAGPCHLYVNSPPAYAASLRSGSTGSEEQPYGYTPVSGWPAAGYPNPSMSPDANLDLEPGRLTPRSSAPYQPGRLLSPGQPELRSSLSRIGQINQLGSVVKVTDPTAASVYQPGMTVDPSSHYFGMDPRLASFVSKHNVVMDDGAVIYTPDGQPGKKLHVQK